jgi:hypothetical protein
MSNGRCAVCGKPLGPTQATHCSAECLLDDGLRPKRYNEPPSGDPRLMPRTGTVSTLSNTLIDLMTANRANDPIYCIHEPNGVFENKYRITTVYVHERGEIGLRIEVIE